MLALKSAYKSRDFAVESSTVGRAEQLGGLQDWLNIGGVGI